MTIHVAEVNLGSYQLVFSKVVDRQQRTILQLPIDINDFKGIHAMLLFDLLDGWSAWDWHL